MLTMTSKEIKNNYGAFVEAARREPVIHTNHGRQTLMTLSIEKAKQIPALEKYIAPLIEVSKEDREERIKQFLALQGSGFDPKNPQSDEYLRARSREFRGND